MNGNGKRENAQAVKVFMRPETRALLDRLADEYHLSLSSVVTIAIVELHKVRFSPMKPERRKRGNGHP